MIAWNIYCLRLTNRTEQNHDEHGIIWPLSIAPYQVLILIINTQDTKQARLAEEVYNSLEKEGIEVLLDDRDLRAGGKFKDADLIGIPLRIVVSEKTLNKQSVEFKKRNEKRVKLIKVKDIFKNVQ